MSNYPKLVLQHSEATFIVPKRSNWMVKSQTVNSKAEMYIEGWKLWENGKIQSPWYKLPKDCSLLLSPTSERRCSKMMINHGFFSRYCINLLRKWILYIKIFVCQGRSYNFKPLTCSMSLGPNCPVCPTPYSSTNAFQSLGNLYEGLCWIAFSSLFKFYGNDYHDGNGHGQDMHT